MVIHSQGHRRRDRPHARSGAPARERGRLRPIGPRLALALRDRAPRRTSRTSCPRRTGCRRRGRARRGPRARRLTGDPLPARPRRPADVAAPPGVLIDPSMTRDEANAVGALLRLLPTCHHCHVRPATCVRRTTKKSEGGRSITFSCDGCAHRTPGLQRFSWADSIVQLHRAADRKAPGAFTPEPHPDHVNTRAS